MKKYASQRSSSARNTRKSSEVEHGKVSRRSVKELGNKRGTVRATKGNWKVGGSIGDDTYTSRLASKLAGGVNRESHGSVDKC